jgi:hypothetical protein
MRPLKDHNNTLFGRPNPGWPIGRPGIGHPQGYLLNIKVEYEEKEMVDYRFCHSAVECEGLI